MFWTYGRFEELSLQQLYEVLALRTRVFIMEQGPFQDTDGVDQFSGHLQGRNAAGELMAYLRLVDPGVKYAEPSIGRVITAPEVRGTGVGKLLMHEGLRRCAQAWPGQGVRISAQARLRRFYAELGFEAVGSEYGEDGIPHIEMLWTPPAPRIAT